MVTNRQQRKKIKSLQYWKKIADPVLWYDTEKVSDVSFETLANTTDLADIPTEAFDSLYDYEQFIFQLKQKNVEILVYLLLGYTVEEIVPLVKGIINTQAVYDQTLLTRKQFLKLSKIQ